MGLVKFFNIKINRPVNFVSISLFQNILYNFNLLNNVSGSSRFNTWGQ